jgi:hypothetical protein
LLSPPIRAHAELLAYFAGVEQSSQHRISYRVAVHPVCGGTEPAASVARHAVASSSLSLGDDLP